MEYFAGIDVSLEQSSVCVVDGAGKIVRETKVASEPEALVFGTHRRWPETRVRQLTDLTLVVFPTTSIPAPLS
jgi:hypothetical protein